MELQHVRGRTWVAVASTALLVVYRVTDTDIILIDTGYAKLDRAGLTALIDSSGFHLRGVICSKRPLFAAALSGAGGGAVDRGGHFRQF